MLKFCLRERSGISAGSWNTVAIPADKESAGLRRVACPLFTEMVPESARIQYLDERIPTVLGQVDAPVGGHVEA